MSSRLIAVVGTGSIGKKHLKAIEAINGIEALAISQRPERRAELKTQGLKTAVDLEEAYSLGVDACIIATDTSRHPDDAVKALSFGMDTLIEKPLATSVNRGILPHEEALKRKRRASVGCVLRFSQALARFRDSLKGVGKLKSIEIECRSYLPDWRPERPYRDSYSARAGEGGVLLDLIHEIDYAGWIFGWPTSIEGTLHNSGKLNIETEETADLRWITPNGVPVTIGLDYLTRPTKRSMTAVGESGTLTWDAVRGSVTLDGQQLFGATDSMDDMFRAQMTAFLNPVKDPRLASSEEGLHALAICDAARRSSESGGTQTKVKS